MADSNSHFGEISRRRWLQMAAGGSAALLAGCTGDGNGGDGQTASVFTTTVPTVPSDMNFNVYATTNPAHIDVQALMHEWPVVYIPGSDKYEKILAKAWSIERDKGSITFKDDVTWHNGDQVTAEDFIVKQKLKQLTSGTENPTISDLKAETDKKVTFSINGGANPELTKRSLAARANPSLLRTPRSVYGEHVTNLEDAKSKGKNELDTVLSDFVKTEIDEKIGAGPFKVKEVTEQYIEFEPHKAHPYGSEINFGTYRMEFSKDPNKRSRGMIDGNYDALKHASKDKAVREKYPDAVQIYKRPSYAHVAAVINQKKKPFDNPNVRQALAHAVDPQRLSERFPTNVSESPTYYTSLSREYVNDWIPKDLGKKFTSYDGQKLDEAKSLLNSAGFTNDGKTWKTPGGKEFNVTVTSPGSGGVRGFAAQVVKEGIEGLGIKTEIRSMNRKTAFGKVKDGDYEMAIWGSGAGNATHPYLPFESHFTPNGWWFQQTNQPKTVSVPPLGDPSGSPREVNVVKKTREAKGLTGAELKTSIQELAWVFNQTVPSVLLAEKTPMAAMRTDKWDLPKADAPVMWATNPVTFLPHLGELKAK